MKNDFEEVALSAASMTSSPTNLSPYLRFGCLSPRMMWERLTNCYGKVRVSVNRKVNVRKERLSEIVGFENLSNVFIAVHYSTSSDTLSEFTT